MSEEQPQSVVNNSGQNPTEKQGVAAANSATQAPQDVTGSVNTNQQQPPKPICSKCSCYSYARRSDGDSLRF